MVNNYYDLSCDGKLGCPTIKRINRNYNLKEMASFLVKSGWIKNAYSFGWICPKCKTKKQEPSFMEIDEIN